MKLFIVFTLLSTFSCTQAQPVYEYRKGHPDGIAKWYMGRQIAQVMSHYGINWLERSEREEEEKCSLLLNMMRIQPGATVADIGAGSGYYSVRMAKLVGDSGAILAVDISKEMLAYINQRVKDSGITSIKTVLGTVTATGLAPATVDMALLADVYHEFEWPREMAASILQSLKPGGKLFLVEYRAEDPDVPIKAVHKMTEKQAVQELTAAGFTFVENLPGLPWQHCLVFQKPL